MTDVAALCFVSLIMFAYKCNARVCQVCCLKLHKDCTAGTCADHMFSHHDAVIVVLFCCCMLTIFSLLAGNINQLILKVSSYAQSLKETQGIIAEFVNPKYKDASKTAFKSSTRLECMMQDYPKALPSSAAVGFTLVNQVRPA